MLIINETKIYFFRVFSYNHSISNTEIRNILISVKMKTEVLLTT